MSNKKWSVHPIKKQVVEISFNEAGYPVEEPVCQMYNGVSEYQSLKNARLIAAAPEMLAALENLENDDGCIPTNAWKIVQDAIRATKGGIS